MAIIEYACPALGQLIPSGTEHIDLADIRATVEGRDVDNDVDITTHSQFECCDQLGQHLDDFGFQHGIASDEAGGMNVPRGYESFADSDTHVQQRSGSGANPTYRIMYISYPRLSI